MPIRKRYKTNAVKFVIPSLSEAPKVFQHTSDKKQILENKKAAKFAKLEKIIFKNK